MSICKSFFQFHNESVNVWSHFVGMMFFVAMIIYTLLAISHMKDAGSFVHKDFHQAIGQKELMASYF